MSLNSLVSSGPLLLAMPVAAAAGAVTFLSPCVLPLVPGYLSYVTGMSGAGAAAWPAGREHGQDTQPGGAQPAADAAGAVAVAVRQPARASAAAWPARRRTVAGALLFVLGFSALFAAYGAAFGGVGSMLQQHQRGIDEVLGAVLIVLGLLFAGAFDRLSLAGRTVKPALRPRAGLASAPLLGVLFGLGWSPCVGPTLSAVLTLTLTTGTAARGAVLAFVYGLGVGIPFIVVAFAVDRGMTVFAFARRHARLITRLGGLLLIVVGALEVSGAWSGALSWLKVHMINGYNPPF